jgi:hypothetical protein
MPPLPNLLVLTVPKTGSTSLYETLANHPDICTSLSKETWFFSDYKNKSINWYKSQFNHYQGETVVCDFASTAMYEKGFSVIIKNTLPNVKILVLLRDPVERCISHYFHEVRVKNESLSLVEALKNEESRILKNSDRYSHIAYKNIGGIYLSRLKELYKNFESNNIYVVSLEEFHDDEEGTLKSVWNFLEISDGENSFSRVNVARKSKNKFVTFLYSIPKILYGKLNNIVHRIGFVPDIFLNKTRVFRASVVRKLKTVYESSYKSVENPDIPLNIRHDLEFFYNKKLKGINGVAQKNIGKYWKWLK